MSFKTEWVANEDRLFKEADSLGELLVRLRGSLSLSALDGHVWETMVRTACDLPPTLAGFPLWIGFPVDSTPPRLSLGLSLIAGTRTAAFFDQAIQTDGTDRADAAIASLLGAADCHDTPLHRITRGRILLHYDAQSHRQGQTGPGLYLYPVPSIMTGESLERHYGDFRLALNAIGSAMGWASGGQMFRHAEQVYQALVPETRLGAIGTRSPKDDALSMLILGFSKVHGLVSVLKAAGWPGNREKVADVLEALDGRGAFSGMRLGAQITINRHGLDPAIDLQIFSANTIYDQAGWFKDTACWGDLITGLHEEGLMAPEAVSGLEGRCSGEHMLFGRCGLLLLLKRIHHFVLALSADSNIQHTDIHMFTLLTQIPQDSEQTNTISR